METSTETISKTDTLTNPNLLDFKDIDKLSIPMLRHYLERFPSHSCDLSIGGILMWADYFKYRYAVFADTLFLQGFDAESNSFLYYVTDGSLPREESERLIREYAVATSNFGKLITGHETTPDDYFIRIKGSNGYIDMWKEYVYPIGRLAMMSGKKMEKKRNHLNYFHSHYPEAETEEINGDNAPELVAFTRRFMDRHDDPVFIYENEKTIDVLNSYGSFPFVGILIRLGGEVIGFSFGEAIGDTFFAHVEKGDIEYRGIYQALASTLYQKVMEIYPAVRYVNREEDMGDDALRRSKESYHPELIVNKKYSEISIF